MTGYLSLYAAPVTHQSTLRRMALPAIIALHILFVYLWIGARHQAAVQGHASMPLVLSFFSPAPEPLETTRPAPVPPVHELKPQPVNIPLPPLAQPDNTPRITATPATAIDQTPQTPQTTPITASSDITATAMRSVGKLDRELRKEFPTIARAQPETMQSKLAKGIAAAGVSQERTMQERISPDGRRVTKISGPGYSYCVTTDNVGHDAGFDQMQRGVQSRTTTCGTLFD
ncbi:hypothetical protein ACO0LO_03745 [Undibacterium sp. TJN25]|uniref:hypothetical protein n=1 Tax=Undibacterium sp. TJN25 TaxID=3413056 RepID=UPI003BF16CC8